MDSAGAEGLEGAEGAEARGRCWLTVTKAGLESGSDPRRKLALHPKVKWLLRCPGQQLSPLHLVVYLTDVPTLPTKDWKWLMAGDTSNK